MPLLGQAAMLLAFDIVPDAIEEHDAWHTHEHLPERLSIPGFRRGTRWTAIRGQPRYIVLYEVADLATLTSPPYLARLDHPSPWTTKMMPSYRNMSRGFCAVTGSVGSGLGAAGLLVRFAPASGREGSLREWLLRDALPPVVSEPGIGSAHLLEGAATPPMTNEQRIRGADAGVDWAVLVTGYSADAVARLAESALAPAAIDAHGAHGATAALYRMEYTLTDRDVAT